MQFRKLSFVLSSLCLLLFFVFAGTAVLAQSSATFQGTVMDPQGGAVPGATVAVKNLATGLQQTATTDATGGFQMSALPPGKYSVEIKHSGFQTLTISSYTLEVGGISTQNYTLKVGELTQTVEISEQAPVITSGTMTVGQVIDQKTVQEIPLNGRHFVDLGLLIPGSVTPPANGFLTAPLRGQGSFGLNTAGNREDTVNFMINGINLNDASQNQITFQPSINTVSEFKADNSTYSAEFGHTSGSIVNIATRSGGNEFHGEAFDYFRNNDLDARNFFNVKTDNNGNPLAQSPFKRNNFGAAVGGPIKHNKAFFFASYEGLRQHQGLTLSAGVPDQATRAGATSPAVLALLAMIPLPNVGSNFVGSASANVNIDQGTGDIAVNLTQNDRLHGYYAIQRDARQEPNLQGNNLPNWGDTRASQRQIMTFAYDHTFSPNLVNEARLGYNRISISFTPNQQLNPTDFDINNGITASIGLPQINVTGGFNIGGPSGFPQGRGDTSAVFSDTLSWIHGRHSVDFGTEIRREYNNNVAQNVGTFSFSNMTNFINDAPSSFTVTIGSGNNRVVAPSVGVFAQDKYRLTPYFTIEAGLRYEWFSTPSEAHNQFTVFDPTTVSLIQVGTNGLNQVYGTNNKNFAPRVGFAWDPFKNGKTSVRAGYGIFYDQPVLNSVGGLSSNPPFATPVSANSTVANPITFENASNFNASSVSPATIDPDFRGDYVQAWNLNVQREITPSLGVTVGYYGSKGTHLRISENLNQPLLTTGVPVKPFPTLSASSPIDPGVALGANIPEVTSGGNSTYNALWVTLTKNLTHGLQIDANYAYSHSIDYNSISSSGVAVQDSRDIQNDRGSSDFDVRHRIVVSALYDLPFKGNRLTSGWELGTIVQAQTGNPLNYVTAVTSVTGTATLRPNVNGPIQVIGSPNEWIAFDPANPVLTVPTNALGNLGRNSVTGPSFVNADFSVIKNTKLTERFTLQFRTEVFDLLNHPNFGNPRLALPSGVVPANSTFNTITSTRTPTGDFGSARQVQFVLKLLF